MLAGDPNRCKPDVHIHRSIKDAFGFDVSNDDCQIIFSQAVDLLKSKYPNLTVRLLDNIVWEKYSGKEDLQKCKIPDVFSEKFAEMQETLPYCCRGGLIKWYRGDWT